MFCLSDSLLVKTKGGAEAEGFTFEIEPKVTSSFLPVSSRDFFSATTRIPGLVSPEVERPPAIPSPQHRTAQLLMTERQKFYEGNGRPQPFHGGSALGGCQQRTRTRSPQRSRTRSPQRSRTRSPQRSRTRSLHRSRSRSAQRSLSRSPQMSLKGQLAVGRAGQSRSKSPREGTGMKELDMYLGNVRPPTDKDSEDILSAWESFIRQKEKPSPPPARRSRSGSIDSVRSRSHSSPRPRYRSRSRSPAAALSFGQDYSYSWRGGRRGDDSGWRGRVHDEWRGKGWRRGGSWSGHGGHRSPGRERVPRDRERGRLSRSPPAWSLTANRLDHPLPSRGGYQGRVGRLQDRPRRPKMVEELPRGKDSPETWRDRGVFESSSRPSSSQGLVEQPTSLEQSVRWRERQEKYEDTVPLNERREGSCAGQQRKSLDEGEERKRVPSEERRAGREERVGREGREEMVWREEKVGREERAGREERVGKEERRSLKDAWTPSHKGRPGDGEPNDLGEGRVRLEGHYATSKNPDGGQRERDKVKGQGREEREASWSSSRKLKEDGNVYGGPREESGPRFPDERERSRESSGSRKFDSRRLTEEIGVSSGMSAGGDGVKSLRRPQEVEERGGKSGTGGAGPRIIRKPVMDDPNLNRPMLSSNELAILERKKREEKERLRQQNSETRPSAPQDRPDFPKGESKRASNEGRGEEVESDRKTSRTDRKERKKKSREKEKKRRRGSSDVDDDEEKKKTGKNDDKKKLKIEASKSGEMADSRGGGRERKDSGDTGEEVGKGRKSQWLDELDLEKEIERRVQQRLREEEAKLREVTASQGQQGAVIRHEQGATDGPEAATDGESSQTLGTARQEVNKASRWDSKSRAGGYDTADYVSDPRGDESEEKRESEERGGREEKGGSEEEENHPMAFIETQSGWCKDMEGNMYYARKWEELEVGWHQDKHGNKYYAHAMDRKSYEEALESLRQETRDREREVQKFRGRGRGYVRGRGRSFFYRGYGVRGRVEFNRKSRSPKRSHSPKRSRSHRRKRSRSRRRRRSSSSSSDSSERRGSSRSRRSKDGRRKSSDSKSKRAERSSAVSDRSVKAADGQKSAERSSRTGSGGGVATELPVTDGEEEMEEQENTEVGFVPGTSGEGLCPTDQQETSQGQSAHWDVDNENWREKVPLKSALKVTLSSRWDKMAMVGELAGQSRWADDLSGGPETDHTGGKASEESLTDLEKFLRNLKQMKKKQWIAEGKVKEKE